MSRLPGKPRQQVRQRAGGRCEYCGKSELFSPYAHHVDHILPVKKHGGSDELVNLAWACFDCNTNKSGSISGYDEGLLIPLFNPRTQVWQDHFDWNGAILVGTTPVGRVTIRVMGINDPDRIETRRELMEAGNW